MSMWQKIVGAFRAPPGPAPAATEAVWTEITLHGKVSDEWLDYNGHVNEVYYSKAFNDAAEVVMERIGVDKAYIEAGLSFFTARIAIDFRMEIDKGSTISNISTITSIGGRKMLLHHELRREDGQIAALCDHVLIHVDLSTRRPCPIPEAVLERARAGPQAAIQPPSIVTP